MEKLLFNLQLILQRNNRVKKWIVNALTFLRILCSMLFGALILGTDDPVRDPLILLLVIFVSDILDGHLARHWGVTTRFGAVFDVTADMFFVAVSFFALILHGVFPPWLLVVATAKFIEFGVTSSILTSTAQNKSSYPTLVFDKLGRLSAILLMVYPLPVLLIHKYLPGSAGQILILSSACLITAMAAVSSGYRLQKCALQRNKSAKTMHQKKQFSELLPCRASCGCCGILKSSDCFAILRNLLKKHYPFLFLRAIPTTTRTIERSTKELAVMGTDIFG